MSKDGPKAQYTQVHVKEAGHPSEAGQSNANTRSTGPRSIHRRKPSIMIGALIAGAGFAICHHLFKARFNSHVVQSESQQKWVIPFRTASAFLIKMFLAVATSSACGQQFWLTVRSEAIRIERVDGMFIALKDVTVFRDIMLWLGNPLLTILAIVMW